jgi:hypothetical protein
MHQDHPPQESRGDDLLGSSHERAQAVLLRDCQAQTGRVRFAQQPLCVLDGEREWLLDQDVLAGDHSPVNRFRVEMMWQTEEDRIDPRIDQRRFEARHSRARIPAPEFPRLRRVAAREVSAYTRAQSLELVGMNRAPPTTPDQTDPRDR